MQKAVLRAGACAVAVASALTVSGHAGAQTRPAASPPATETDTANDDLSGDIIVTATKRDERLNRVPAAVSAFTAEDRSLRGINSTQDVAAFTPSMSVADSPNNRVSIRGVGRVTNSLGSDPGVANYTDGFYTSESDVIAGSDFLIQRVEVLRGPQGTLYGRNSIGGAINVISKRPTKELAFEGRAFVNDYRRYGGAASISGPLSDTVRFRLAAIGANQDKGYIHNIAGPDQNTDERYTVEGQLEADILPNLNAWVRVAHTRYDQRPGASEAIDSYAKVPYFGGLVANAQYGIPDAQNPSLTDRHSVAYNFGGRQKLDKNFTVVTNVTLDTREVIVRYVGGYSQYNYYQNRDFDGTARTSFRQPAFGTTFPVSTNYVEVVEEKKRWMSHELNFLSAPGGRFDWIIGMYYYHEKLDQPYAITVPDVALFDDPTELAGVPTISNPLRAYYAQRGQLRSTALAAFGQATLRITPALSIVGGVRYSYDQKRAREDQLQVFYNVAVDPGHTYGVLNRGRNLRGDWGDFTGDFTVNFTPDDATSAYAKISRGYKSGGFLLGALAPNPIVDKERITAYEVGLKRAFGPFQLNSAAYYYDYRNLQVPVSLQVAPGVIQSVFYNAPRARSYGIEAEVNVRPVKPLRLSVIYSYLNSRFLEFSGVVDPASASSAPQNLAGGQLPQSPHNKLTLNGVLTLGPIDFSATQTFVDSQYYAVFSTNSYRAPAYQNTTLRLTYRALGDRFELIGTASNLFNTISYSYVSASSFSSGAVRSVYLRQPRVFALEGRVKF